MASVRSPRGIVSVANPPNHLSTFTPGTSHPIRWITYSAITSYSATAPQAWRAAIIASLR
jgi:hypothetical protein